MTSHIHGLDRCAHAFAGEEVHWLCGMEPVFTNKATANTVDTDAGWIMDLADLSTIEVTYTNNDDGLHLWCQQCESELPWLAVGDDGKREKLFNPTLAELVAIAVRHQADTIVARQPLPDAQDIAEHDEHEAHWVHDPTADVQHADADALDSFVPSAS